MGGLGTRRTVSRNALLFGDLSQAYCFRGKYDYEFIDYTIRVLRKCKEYGFRILMDPHQDTVRSFLHLR